MKMTIVTILVLCLVGMPIFADPYNDGFAAAKPAKYIENYKELRHDIGFEKVAGMVGKYCLRLRYENQKAAELPKIPVKPGERYAFSFRSKFGNSETAENNPFLRDPPLHTHLVHLPAVKIVTDKAYAILLTSGEWRRYRRVITIPPKTGFMQFSFSSGYNNGRLYIDDLRLKPLEVNPKKFEFVFDGNEYDYSGWATAQRYSQMVEIEGQSFFYTAYGSTTETFPLQPDSEYILTLTGKPHKPGAHGFGHINFLDETGKSIGKTSLPKMDEDGKGSYQVEVKSPTNAVYGNLLLYNLLLKRIGIQEE